MPDEIIPPPCRVDPEGHARHVLEFSKVLERVAAEAQSAGGRARVLALVPEVDPERVAAQQELVLEVRRALDEGRAPWALAGLHDIEDSLRDAERPGTRLEPAELRRVADALEVATRVRRQLDAHAEHLPRVRELASGLGLHDEVVQAVRAVIDERGELVDAASPRLRQLRRQIQDGRAALLQRLEALMRAAGASPDPYVTLRSDRYVIPVRADSEQRVRGIVHDRSASGATLFVEPLEVLDANNDLQRLRAEEQQEILRILLELTERVGAEGPAARASLAAAHELDALQARASWARTAGAATPRRGGAILLRSARHPLLDVRLRDAGGAVPLDVDLRAARALVITGPNTGGKTVALKTVGLLALMHQAGLQIPAHPDSQLPVFERVCADIGDEQSIETAESTFSSHLRHVIEVLEAAGPHTLALLDELMAGTDPEEGSALAQVVLRRLVARGGTTLVTTHLGALKLFAHAEPGLANAGMSFDPASRAPLFRLQPGVPGSSNALAIAARLGLDPELLAEAQSARGAAAGQLEAALEALESERARLAGARTEAEAAAAESQRVREEHAALLAQLTAKRRTALEDARREAAGLLSGAQARIEAVVRDLRERQASAESIRAAHAEVRELAAELHAPPNPGPGPEPDGELRPGSRVWVQPLGREGILEDHTADGRARVRLGNVSVSVQAADLIPRGGTTSQGESPAPAAPRPGGYSAPEGAPVSSRIDVRGMERDAALEAVDRFLDRLVLQGVHVAEIVHGKGTGVLRQRVQEHLARHPQVAGYRLGEHGEGGSGVTIVQLR